MQDKLIYPEDVTEQSLPSILHEGWPNVEIGRNEYGDLTAHADWSQEYNYSCNVFIQNNGQEIRLYRRFPTNPNTRHEDLRAYVHRTNATDFRFNVSLLEDNSILFERFISFREGKSQKEARAIAKQFLYALPKKILKATPAIFE